VRRARECSNHGEVQLVELDCWPSGPAWKQRVAKSWVKRATLFRELIPRDRRSVLLESQVTDLLKALGHTDHADGSLVSFDHNGHRKSRVPATSTTSEVARGCLDVGKGDLVSERGSLSERVSWA